MFSCRAFQDDQNKERDAEDSESRFVRSANVHQPITIKEPAVQIKLTRSRHPQKRSKKNLDSFYAVLAPGSVRKSGSKYLSYTRTGETCVTVQNSEKANRQEGHVYRNADKN